MGEDSESLKLDESEECGSHGNKWCNTKLSMLSIDNVTLSKLLKLKISSFQEFQLRRPAISKILTKEKIEEVEEKFKSYLVTQKTKPACGLVEWKNIEMKKEFCIRSFSQAVDGKLCGGFKPKLIYELIGAPGSGKTQFSLQLLSSAFIPKSLQGLDSQRVIFIDTEFSFFVDRMNEVLAKTIEHCQKLNPKLSADQMFSVEEISKRIECFRCTKVDELIQILNSIVNEVRTRSSGNPQVLIIDSVASPFRLPSFESVKQRCSAIAQLCSVLAQFVQLTGACVILTNHITTKLVDDLNGTTVGNYFVPLLGDFWSSNANVRALLSEDSNGRKFTVFKNRPSLICAMESHNSSASFQITRGGIRDVF